MNQTERNELRKPCNVCSKSRVYFRTGSQTFRCSGCGSVSQ